jgi:hypothetical protein
MMGGLHVWVVGKLNVSDGSIVVLDICSTKKKADSMVRLRGEGSSARLDVWCWEVNGGEVKNDAAL